MADKELKYYSDKKCFKETKGDVGLTYLDDHDDCCHQDQIKIRFFKQWENEFNLSVRLTSALLYDGEHGEKEVKEQNKKISVENNFFKHEYYDIDDGKEWLFTLKEKPKTNQIRFSLNTKGLDLHLQPPLTEEYTPGWSKEFGCNIDVTETHVTNSETGKILVHSPENNINSFAIYNNQGKVHDIIYPDRTVHYGCGKLGHIERSCLFLHNNQKIWINQYIDGDNLVMVIPDIIMNDDSYWTNGIRIHPTFGYNTVGSTYSYVAGAFKRAHLESSLLYTASTGDTLTQLSIYAACEYSGSNYFKMTIYDVISGTVTNRILAAQQIDLTTTPGWFLSASLSQGLNNGTIYSCAVGDGNQDAANGNYYYYDTSSGGQTSLHTISNTLDNPWTSNNTTARKISMKGTVTAGGSASLAKTYFIN